jgi:hypothetical protein
MRASSGAIGVAITSAVVAMYLLHHRHESCRSEDDEKLNKDDVIKKPKPDESRKDETELMPSSSHEPESPVKVVSSQPVNNFLLCLDPSGTVIQPTSNVTYSPTSVIHPIKKIQDKAEMLTFPLKYKQDNGKQTGNSVESTLSGTRHLLIPRTSSLSSLLPKSNSLPSLTTTTSHRNSDVPVWSVAKSQVPENTEGFIISIEDLLMCNELMLQRADEDRLYGSYDYGDDEAAELNVRRPRSHSDVGLPVR